MNSRKDFQNHLSKISRCFVILIFVIFIFMNNGNIAIGDEDIEIADFYEHVNNEWLENTIIPENAVVVNNWGILWDKIIDKSIENLSGNSSYILDKKSEYTLQQLKNFYKSTYKFSDDPRKRVDLVQKNFPMLMGIIFSEITPTPEKKHRIEQVIQYLKIAYAHALENSTKLNKYYKDLFLIKLNSMEFEIGAPDLSNFQQIPILYPDSLEKNIRVSEEYQLTRNETDWSTPPFETDCFYNVYDNKIKIYAGTLYDFDWTTDADFPYLLATIGRTIGHEMTHAFDTVGKNYDQDGKKIGGLKKLFAGAGSDKKEWEPIYAALRNQFSNYTVQDSLHVDGEITLQENFADLGGLEISFAALKLYLKENYPHYSEEEYNEVLRNFFIAYAQYWKEKATPEFELSTLDRIHTPQKFRAIGPLYNQDEFYEIFEVDTTSKYFIPKEQRISIW